MFIDIRKLLGDPSYSDMIIRVRGRDLPVRRRILASNSPVFRAMFRKHTKESMERTVDFRCYPRKAVEAMLSFVYKGKLCEEAYSFKVFQMADMFDIKDLKLACERRLLSTLTPRNAFAYYKKAFLVNASYLEEKALQMIRYWVPVLKVTDSSQFLNRNKKWSRTPKVQSVKRPQPSVYGKRASVQSSMSWKLSGKRFWANGWS
jgi:BTB/POZ domain